MVQTEVIEPVVGREVRHLHSISLRRIRLTHLHTSSVFEITRKHSETVGKSETLEYELGGQGVPTASRVYARPSVGARIHAPARSFQVQICVVEITI